MLPLSQCLLFRLCCILPSVFQVKCSMLLWAIRWLLRRPVWNVRGGKLSWRPLASFMLPGGRVWTDVTMAGSLMVVHDIQFQYPECSVGEAWSVSGPCTATETRLASRNQLRSSELTVLKVNLHTSCCCQKIYSVSRKKCHLPMVGHMVCTFIVWFRQWQMVIEGTEVSLSKAGLDCKELWSHLLFASAPPPFDFLPLCTTVSISTSAPDQHFNMFTTRLKFGSLFCSMYFLLHDCIVSVTTTTTQAKEGFLYERWALCARLLIQMSVSSWPHCLTL